ncbi:hypothetical protein AB0D42_38880 [Streptomyces sp. NPDC048304]|uniref:hypothetical protein n=1 Tax=Streptomyces sp. NPDC048304 TaxID=3154820 RepID=UPI0033DD60E5
MSARRPRAARAAGRTPQGPDDVRIPAGYNAVLFDGDAFAALLTKIRAHPEQWERVSS